MMMPWQPEKQNPLSMSSEESVSTPHDVNEAVDNSHFFGKGGHSDKRCIFASDEE